MESCLSVSVHCILIVSFKWFISETPVGVHERTSMKEHLLWHGSKHKIQVHTAKRNKRQQKNEIVRISKTKQKRETREISLTKTKARGKKIDGYCKHTLTHSHTLTRTCTSTHTHTHTPKIWGKGVCLELSFSVFVYPSVSVHLSIDSSSHPTCLTVHNV